jgi:alkylation response protein AidB-like acyl-CoA dehydrogenase
MTTALLPPLNSDPLDVLMDTLALRARQVSREHDSLQDDVRILHAHGWLMACAPTEAGGLGLGYKSGHFDLALDFLFRLGSSNLALGRLFEGHMNACKLVAMLGSPEQAFAVWEKIRAGALLGVWGADGQKPVTLQSCVAQAMAPMEKFDQPGPLLQELPKAEGQDRLHLAGEKAFCSGLGCVSLAIVSSRSKDGLQLVLADVDDPPRHDKSQWLLSGMQATQSGTFDFEDFPQTRFSLLGPPDAYFEEPHFLGGQWRYLALYAGAVATIAQAVSHHLQKLQRPPSDSEKMRLAQIVGLAHQVRLWAGSIGHDTEVAPDRDASVQAVIGRELVEHACVEAMALAERVIGTRAYQVGTRIERVCRDLRTYLRQAALDQRLSHAGQKILALSPTGQSFLAHCGAGKVSPA